MSLWQRLLRSLGLYRSTKVLQLDLPLLQSIQDLAYQEQRPTEDVAAELLSIALDQWGTYEAHLQCWKSLTSREQEVTALVCQGYSNAAIAVRLSLSLSTIKTHVHNILKKWGVKSRVDLQGMLTGWDFQSWLETIH
jgi:DNA-binding NarL/FixJ family response regulator